MTQACRVERLGLVLLQLQYAAHVVVSKSLDFDSFRFKRGKDFIILLMLWSAYLV
jgi:hypothetical protein